MNKNIRNLNINTKQIIPGKVTTENDKFITFKS